jgi:hypothetical protein
VYGVPLQGEDPQAVEGSKPRESVNQGVELVIPEAEMLQRGDLRVKALNLLDLVIEQGEILELGERVQTLDLRDPVEAEVELLEVHEVVQILDPGDEVVVQLELGELLERAQVLDLTDVLEAI